MIRTLSACLAAAAVGALVVVAGSTAGAATSTWCGGAGKVVILGDSLSTGYGTTGYDASASRGYQKTTYAWPSRWDGKPNTTVVNLAKNGGLVSDFLTDGLDGRAEGPLQPTAVSRIKSEQPHLVIIELGGNEYLSDRDPVKVFQANLKKLAYRIKVAAPNARLLFVRGYHFDYRNVDAAHQPVDFTWTQYGSAIKTVAGGQWFLDLSGYLPSARYNSAGLYVKDEYGPNLAVHATDAGHIAMFAALWGKVQCR